METENLIKEEPISPTCTLNTPTINQLWSINDIKNLGRGIEKYGNNNWENIVKDETFKLYNFSPEALKNKWEQILESVFQPPIANKSISEKIVYPTTSSSSPVVPEKSSKFLYVNASQFKPVNPVTKLGLGINLARRTKPPNQKESSNALVKKNIYTQKPITQTQSTQRDFITQTNNQTTSKDAIFGTETSENNIFEKTSNESPPLPNNYLNCKRKATYSFRPRKPQILSQTNLSKNNNVEESSSETSVSDSDDGNDSECYKQEIQNPPEPSEPSFKVSDVENSEISSEEDVKSSGTSNQFISLKSRRLRHLWTREEEEALRKGIETYGEGQWAVIRADPSLAIHSRRSKVDIKDKWRTICRQVKIKSKPIPQPVTRQPRKRWSTDEVKALCEGVNLFGAGHWKKIAEDVRLFGRTTVQLKDKWRNLTFLGISNEAQFFSVLDENHDVLIKDGMPWEILSQDAQSAALMALSHLLPSCKSSAPKKIITIRILPQFSNQVIVYHGAWASVTPTFPIAQLQCRELLNFNEDGLPSPTFSSTPKKREQDCTEENNDLNTNEDDERNQSNNPHSTITTEQNFPHINKTTAQLEDHVFINNDNNIVNDKLLSDNTKQDNMLNGENEPVYEADIYLDNENISHTTKTSQHNRPPYSESGDSAYNHTGYISEIYDLTVDSNDFV